MSEDVWGTALDRIVELFQGRTPFNNDEETAVMKAWQTNPAAIMELALTASVRYSDGSIQRPWAWMAKAAAETAAQQPVARSFTANPQQELGRAERSAATLMRNTLFHLDRWAEAEDELFGDRGVLRLWKDDASIVAEWKAKWEAVKELGERTEIESAMKADRLAASPIYKKWTLRKPEDSEVRLLAWKNSTDPVVQEVWARLEREANQPPTLQS